jgi:hypothetical protein
MSNSGVKRLKQAKATWRHFCGPNKDQKKKKKKSAPISKPLELNP